VVYWNNIPSPYTVDRLNAVVDRGTIDLEAWFCARTESDRSWDVQEQSFHFPHRYLPGPSPRRRWARGHYLNVPAPLLGRRLPDLLVSLYAEPTFLAGWELARARGVRTAFRYLPTYDRWVARTARKERLKRAVFRRADGFKTPGPEGEARLLAYGVDPARIHHVTQSIDVPRFLDGAAAWRPRREETRRALGLDGTVFVFVGRLWRGKGLDYLFDAYERIASGDVGPTTLLLVGDGVDEARYRGRARALASGHVVFAGFVQQPDLPRLYAAADVLVLPTLGDPNGLVIEEAMVSGLPVIAFDSAGDIRQRVPEGVAGHVVPTADTRLLAERMMALARDPSARAGMGAAAREIASLKTHDRYAEDFERFVEGVMASPGPGTSGPVRRRPGPPREPPSATGTTGSGRRPRVVYWNNIPSPYMVDRFNAVADRGRLEFEAWFSARTEAERSWAVDEGSWRFRHRYLPGIGQGEHRLEIPVGLLARRRPDVMFSLYASPSFLAGSVLAAVGGTKTALWSEVTFDSWVPRRRWREAVKGALFPRVDGILTVGQDGRRFAERYGARPERVHLAPHVIDVPGFSARADAVRQRREAVRAEIGIRGVAYLYVGRLWLSGKGIDTLLEAYGRVVRRTAGPTTLVLVGDGPDEPLIRERAGSLGLPGVVFAGFQPETRLPTFYAACDVFVFPTRGDPYGLVLDEAMACSLPLISSSAAGELDLRVRDRENGRIVPPGDAEALAEAMADVAADTGRMRAMGELSRRMVEGRTPERWALDFEAAVLAILGADPAR